MMSGFLTTRVRLHVSLAFEGAGFCGEGLSILLENLLVSAPHSIGEMVKVPHILIIIQ